MWKWLTRLLSGRPHFVIGGAKAPYLLRWFLIPRNPWVNLYLHKFLRDDDDRALHDHPWWFISFMIRGEYFETLPDPNYHPIQHTNREFYIHRKAPSIAFRAATHRHRVTLARDGDLNRKPCWTIVLTGKSVREWGFWCPKGFVPWRQFVDERDDGNIGKGCGE